MSDTDRELLEAAAKAAGLTIEYWAQEDYPVVRDGVANVGWNPLVFDSDALRLAVKLRLVVDVGSMASHAFREGPGEVEAHGSDPYAATRRAIVRAASALAHEHDPDA